MKLLPAQMLSQKVRDELAPFCERIAVAGSIRRERPEVNDIDLLLIPKEGQLDKIIERVSRNCEQLYGRHLTSQNLKFKFKSGFEMDLFIAKAETADLVSRTPGNWGAVLLCRTGSMVHNQQLCSHAIRKGLKFAPYKGVVRPVRNEETHPLGAKMVDFEEKLIASESEAEIYAALGLEYLEPTNREVLPLPAMEKQIAPV
jgi:DNA polymerase (family 10)